MKFIEWERLNLQTEPKVRGRLVPSIVWKQDIYIYIYMCGIQYSSQFRAGSREEQTYYPMEITEIYEKKLFVTREQDDAIQELFKSRSWSIMHNSGKLLSTFS